MFFKTFFRIGIFFFLFLFFSPFVFSEDVSFHFLKETYRPLETASVEVFISNITLTKDLEISQLVLLDTHNRSFDLAVSKIKINSTFYVFYFDLPLLTSGIYSLALRNVGFTKEGLFSLGSFSSPLSVREQAGALFTFRPGYVVRKLSAYEEASFSLIFTNPTSESLLVQLEKVGDFFTLDKPSFTLASGSSKTVMVTTSLRTFSNATLEGGIKLISKDFSSFLPFLVYRSGLTPVLPIVVLPVNESSVVLPPIVVNYSALKQPLYLTTLLDEIKENLTLHLELGVPYRAVNLILVNNASVDFHFVNYSISSNLEGLLTLKPTTTLLLKANDTALFLFGVNNSYDFIPGSYHGFLDIKSAEGVHLSLPLFITVLGTLKPVVNLSTNITKNATIASAGLNQSLPLREEHKNSFGLWIFLLIVLFIFLIIIFSIYKKTQQKKSEFEGFVDRLNSRRN